MSGKIKKYLINPFLEVVKYSLGHKFVSIGFILILIIGGYFIIPSVFVGSSKIQYVLAKVQKNDIVISISGSGQISASNQIDLKSKVSGDVLSVSVKQGDIVKSGQVIARIDSGDVEKTIRDAQINLESAKISFEKIKQPADNLSIIQAQNSLTQAKQSKQDAEDNLIKSFDDGFNSVANSFLDLPSIVSGLEDIINGDDINSSQGNFYAYYDSIKNIKTEALQFLNSAIETYQKARTIYETNLQNYKNISRYSETAQIEDLIEETYQATKLIAESIKNVKNFLDLVDDTQTSQSMSSILSSHQNSIQEFTSTTNSHLGSLLNIQNTIKDNRNSIVNTQYSIDEKIESLKNLQDGPDDLDVQSQELSLIQKENSLQDAKEKLSDYYVKSPFNGMVAQIDIKKGDNVSSATSIATVITTEKIAEISLNEVDIAKVKVGQEATLEFDAIPDLKVVGKVAEVDVIGTATQGVVSYDVKISFNTDNIQVKPGMSVSASIIIEQKKDVLSVLNTAIKSLGGASYVEFFENTSPNSNQRNQTIETDNLPKKQKVEVGISDDSLTEITGGLEEGSWIVARSVVSNSSNSTQTTQSSVNTIRASGGGGVGGFMIPR
ncbi:MAG: HlyD family efflux transporter periplasmic adaptor subunit [Candidatus Paceibacterota bacterium]|jgi:HlyD family secretion protein